MLTKCYLPPSLFLFLSLTTAGFWRFSLAKSSFRKVGLARVLGLDNSSSAILFTFFNKGLRLGDKAVVGNWLLNLDNYSFDTGNALISLGMKVNRSLALRIFRPHGLQTWSDSSHELVTSIPITSTI